MTAELPLAGVTIGITRAQEQSRSLIQRIEALGGTAVAVPLLAFQAAKDKRKILDKLTQLHTYDWIILTSANGVHFFLKDVQETNMLSILESKKIAVVGRKTSAVLQDYGIEANLLPKNFVAEDLLQELQANLHKTSRVLIVKGNLSRDVIYEGLKRNGFSVDEITVYETIENEEAEEKLLQVLTEQKLDYFTFTSPSSVNHFVNILYKHSIPLKHNLTFVCIGPITAQAAQHAKLHPLLVAGEYTTEGMIQEIIEHIRRQKHV
ncbi:uroporphyrinogen-III synthase [Alkalihalobacillus sp. BA299]|uniref:uroporphyrinogen-III synthase n=1 Tax=Alkalihalobacillus sp. BA299 TaxID=2815938 RepID=UPI001AD9A7E4|nr:uroporphyrinogen-III synthase [Alkalihalobacillus sp. BA299]